MSSIHLLARPGQENERGPLYMESAIAAMHSLRGKDATVSLEMGFYDGKVVFFATTTPHATTLVESQVYGQYPDSDIEHMGDDPFLALEGEEVTSVDLRFSGPDVAPIKRHPQFDDLLTRANMDPLSGIASSLARYNAPGMRGHVQIVLKPLGGSFRRRALRFLPLLQRGLPHAWHWYGTFFTRMQLARGWRRVAFFPIAFLMGGFRAWPIFSRISRIAAQGDPTIHSPLDEEDIDTSARSHDREDSVSAAKDKVNRLLFLCNIRVSVIAPKAQRMEAERKVVEIAGSFRQFHLPQSNGFLMGSIQTTQQLLRGFQHSTFVLSAEEIATLWHMPTILVQTASLDRIQSKKLEPPVNLPIPTYAPAGASADRPDFIDSGITIIGEALYQGRRTRFGIKPDDRRRHIYAIGKTGMGKSTLLENMIFSDVLAGRGIAVIDPHGDLIEAIVRCIPKNRTNDVVLFDPSDREYPVSFNLLECPNRDQRPLIASGLMSVFTKLWPEAFSGRMEHILRNTLLALLEYEGSTMLGILRMFGDDAYRLKVVSHVTDPVVKSFWETEYTGWSDKYRTEAVAAIQNKIGQLVTTPLIRNIVGQVTSTLNVRHAMDTGKIILVNLSKGKLGEDTSAFIGSMLVTKFQIDAMSRADIPESERRDFYLYVDEFQNFATQSFATILSEARKYRLSLTIAHQYVGQLLIGERNTALRDAVFGNVGTMITFQVGSDDAEVFSLQYEELAMPKDLLSLPKYHAYLRLMIDGVTSKPFSIDTLPPPKIDKEKAEERMEVIRMLSRERYAQKRSVVEEKIMRWAASAAEGKANAKSTEKAKEKEEEEKKKAKAKGMKLDEYRTWRDREMWTNEYNAIRKKAFLGEKLSDDEAKRKAELEKKLEQSGGVPPPSKAMLNPKGK